MARVQVPDKVLDYLYIGSAYTSFESMRERARPLTASGNFKGTNVYWILNVKGGSYAANGQFEKVIVPIDDFGRTNLDECLNECFDVIEKAKEAKKGVLVHCQAGMNRSATVVLAYLVLREGWTLKEAWTHLKQCRKAVSPHRAYWTQLRALEQRKHGKISLTEEEVGPTLQDLIEQEAKRDTK